MSPYKAANTGNNESEPSNVCGVRQQAIFMQCYCGISIFVVVSQLYVYVLHLNIFIFLKTGRAEVYGSTLGDP